MTLTASKSVENLFGRQSGAPSRDKASNWPKKYASGRFSDFGWRFSSVFSAPIP